MLCHPNLVQLEADLMIGSVEPVVIGQRPSTIFCNNSTGHIQGESRHDAIVSFVSRLLEVQGYDVSVEPRIKSDRGLRKPDIVAKLGVTAFVLDAQVVNDQISLDDAHRRKIDYYQDIERNVKEKFRVQNVICSSITLSWKGLWSQKSVESLTDLGVLKKKHIKIISTRAIIGGLASFHIFNKATQVQGRAG